MHWKTGDKMAGKGKDWEAVCENSRAKMQQDNRIHWMPMHPPVINIGPGTKKRPGSFLAAWKGKGPPDWIALCSGISILGDDKDARKSPWRTKNIKPHQVDAFQLHVKNGGLACILLRMPDYSRWVLPWSDLRQIGSKGSLEIVDGILVDKKTGEPIGLKWNEKEAINRKTNKTQMIPFDWLTPLLESADYEY
tara:strand:- start:1213 stop:1791 length:579 start_codon:yes stop_codon:yes gene_type:complete